MSEPSSTKLLSQCLAVAKQCIVTTVSDWMGIKGVLQLYERDHAEQQWRGIKPAVDIVVGRNGMGWGRGLQPFRENQKPLKKEGDGKSPAGIFRLSQVFGYLSSDRVQDLKMPYIPITDEWICVDDPHSKHYNQIIRQNHVGEKDWQSAEWMAQVGNPYRWGIVVDHNREPITPGCGSCIFLHIWDGPQVGTSGCTAMKDEDMEQLVYWLDAGKNPLLVQLPIDEYRRLRGEWNLPLK